jgi:hypothetical protein
LNNKSVKNQEVDFSIDKDLFKSSLEEFNVSLKNIFFSKESDDTSIKEA